METIESIPDGKIAMIILVGLLLLILLAVGAAAAKKRGASGGKVALIVVFGVVCIGAAVLAISLLEFSGPWLACVHRENAK
jgi:multisubunit Na+/H+ antiporter MnhB subunit